MSAPANPVAASSGTQPNTNVLQWKLIRLPLGHSATDDAPQGPKSYFQLVIPTNAGGELVLVPQAQDGQVTLIDERASTTIAGPSRTIRHKVPRGSFGIRYVVLEGSSRTISCEFIQTAVARDGTSDSDPPLIPWNFYFWPSARTFRDGTPNQDADNAKTILRKYAKAFGSSETLAVQWEHDHHQQDVGDPWYGHCHLSSAASILFEQPADRTVNTPRGPVAFTGEELEFLAAEWFGNFANKTLTFTLEHPNPPWKRQLGMTPFSQMLKPSEANLPIVEIGRKLKAAILLYNRNLSDAVAQTMADEAVAKGASLSRHIKEEFGQRAADFFDALLTEMLDRKHAFVADLRGAGAGNSPIEVWNHAVFYFQAKYKEVDPSKEDPLYVEIEVLLVANHDSPQLPSTGLPATVLRIGSAEHIDVDGSGTPNRKSCQILRLNFDAATGKIIKSANTNEWRSSRDGSRTAELYAPAFLSTIGDVGSPPGTAQHTPEPNELANGNIAIGPNLVEGQAPLLKPRKRYVK